ncbi:MAG: phenylalanine--tRNA ligase subunit beta, partial [bacterium]
MNLNISYNWLKSYVKTNLSAQEFAKKISLSGPSVDHITEIKQNFEKVVVGQIIKIDQHPDADKLHVCKVNVGKEELQIVCGAPNILEGQKVPVVLVGGKVGNFEIKSAKLRGVESFGMMCSQKELGIGEDHTGIFILPDYTEVGLPLEKIMPISDAILDLEVTSNRPDAMCVIGLAREASAILEEKFLYEIPKPNFAVKGEKKKLSVTVKESKLCPRYQAMVMTDVKVGPSPLWLQQRLLASDLRPINNLVDITNYILLEFGQPMHVFDYDKLTGNEINVRIAKKGETILALDGKSYGLSEEHLVIADAKNPVAVAGVMGGELSATTPETKTIVFECANFDSVSVRKTSRALNLRSDSSNLYEKGLSSMNVEASMLRAIELAQELAGAKAVSEIIDVNNHKFKAQEIKLDAQNVERMLGVEIKPAKIKDILESLGFKVTVAKTEMKVSVPWWRDGDVEGEHDLIEEVARLYGYHNLPTKLMAGDLPENFSSDNFYWQNKAKDILAGMGLTEIYTYSFISEKQIANCRLDVASHIKISNPLSSDFEYMRTSLVPGALQIIAENVGFYPEVQLFDLSNVYLPLKANDLPQEKETLLIAVSSKNSSDALSKAKGIFEGLVSRLNIKIKYKETTDSAGAFGSPVAEILVNEKNIGSIGMTSQKVLSAYGIKNSVAILEVDFATIAINTKSAPTYQPIPKFPAIELDLSVEISGGITFAEVANVATDA